MVDIIEAQEGESTIGIDASDLVDDASNDDPVDAPLALKRFKRSFWDLGRIL